MKIVFIHSLNNYTGSPNILSIVIKELIRCGYTAEIVTSRSEGFLSRIENAGYRYTCYRWTECMGRTILLLLLSQLGVFFRCFLGSQKHIYYINTIVPFGAVIACWLTRKRYIIHVHENMQQHKSLYILLKQIYRFCNRKTIFVSDYLAKQAINCRSGIVIPNVLSNEFIQIANKCERKGENILMLSSCRRYKGIYVFAELARMLPAYSFELVLSANKEKVEQFKAEIGVIPNLTVYTYQTNVHPFFQRAKLLLQLSQPSECVETFGLTILEGMAYGIPTIVPSVGGPIELVDNGKNGYTLDPTNLSLIQRRIEKLMNENELYEKFARNAKRKSMDYTQARIIKAIENYIK